MRIAAGGSMSNYVQFALRFLRENPKTPLVLHTLSPAQVDPKPAAVSAALNAQQEPNPNPVPDLGEAPSSSSSLSSSTFLPCTLAIPRLISVVEIVKRTYIDELKKHYGTRQSGSGVGASESTSVAWKGKGKQSERVQGMNEENVGSSGKGIWQYTESGLYTPPAQSTLSVGTVAEAPGGLGDLARVLGGRTKPKMTHHPYMQITLSTRPLPTPNPTTKELDHPALTTHAPRNRSTSSNITVQYILAKKKSRGKKKSNNKNKGNSNSNSDSDSNSNSRGVMIGRDDASNAYEVDGEDVDMTADQPESDRATGAGTGPATAMNVSASSCARGASTMPITQHKPNSEKKNKQKEKHNAVPTADQDQEQDQAARGGSGGAALAGTRPKGNGGSKRKSDAVDPHAKKRKTKSG
ncbi:hypothetical protein IAU59_006365 [Kwoniella sp. CBS 9459]